MMSGSCSQREGLRSVPGSSSCCTRRPATTPRPRYREHAVDDHPGDYRTEGCPPHGIISSPDDPRADAAPRPMGHVVCGNSAGERSCGHKGDECDLVNAHPLERIDHPSLQEETCDQNGRSQVYTLICPSEPPSTACNSASIRSAQPTSASSWVPLSPAGCRRSRRLLLFRLCSHSHRGHLVGRCRRVTIIKWVTGILLAHGALIVALIQYVKQANQHRINIASHFLTKAGTLNAP